MKSNKLIYVLSIILVIGVISTGVVYASVKIYEHIKARQNLVAVTTNPIYEDTNTIWVGSFQLAWNELKDYVGGNIKFKGYQSDLVNKLNTATFGKDMLNEEDYYIKTALLTPGLKEEILMDLENKFGNADKFDLINSFNYNGEEWGYFIYSVIDKKFEFLTPFDKLEEDSFKNSEEKFEYFGIDSNTNDFADENVEVLFYNTPNDFAVKLNTKNNEDVFLYRTENVASFEELYNEMQEKSNKYKGDRNFDSADKLKIPCIKVDTLINYDELCNKVIEGTDDVYISNALQNVKFNLNETGGALISETILHLMSYADPLKAREFYFTDKFVMFLKESDKKDFYMALSVDDSDVLH